MRLSFWLDLFWGNAPLWLWQLSTLNATFFNLCKRVRKVIIRKSISCQQRVPMNYSGILYTEKISKIYLQKVCSALQARTVMWKWWQLIWRQHNWKNSWFISNFLAFSKNLYFVIMSLFWQSHKVQQQNFSAKKAP